MPTDRFLFIGFPPRKKSALDKLLDSLKEEKGTLIFYQSAKRLSSFLERLYQILGNREIVIARELTKIHEEFLRGRIEDITLNLKDKILKGEIVVLVKGKKEK